MKDWIPLSTLPVALIASTVPGFANTYLTVQQAQQVIFPGEHLTSVNAILTPEQQKSIETKSSVRVLSKKLNAWKSAHGGWFIVDQVIGKHEYITYAVGLNPSGSVKQIEILDYRETYGYQVRDQSWRQQFTGKTVGSPVKLDQDIKNISGATLSSRHITDGVRRLLATYDLVLRQL